MSVRNLPAKLPEPYWFMLPTGAACAWHIVAEAPFTTLCGLQLGKSDRERIEFTQMLEDTRRGCLACWDEVAVRLELKVVA